MKNTYTFSRNKPWYSSATNHGEIFCSRVCSDQFVDIDIPRHEDCPVVQQLARSGTFRPGGNS